MAKCPSDEFLKEVSTVTGLTPEKPYTLIPTQLAYAEWLSTAQNLLTKTRREYVAYTTAKPPEKWNEEETAEWNKLGTEFDSLVETYNGLPHPWELFDTSFPGELIDQSVNLSLDLACLWNRIYTAVSSLGGRAIGPTGIEKGGGMGILEKALTVGGILGGGFLLVYAAHSFQNRKKTP